MSRLLGRAASWRGVHPGDGTANALFRLDNGYLELIAQHAVGGPRGKVVASVIENRGEGLVALAFGTDDISSQDMTVRSRTRTHWRLSPRVSLSSWMTSDVGELKLVQEQSSNVAQAKAKTEVARRYGFSTEGKYQLRTSEVR